MCLWGKESCKHHDLTCMVISLQRTKYFLLVMRNYVLSSFFKFTFLRVKNGLFIFAYQSQFPLLPLPQLPFMRQRGYGQEDHRFEASLFMSFYPGVYSLVFLESTVVYVIPSPPIQRAHLIKWTLLALQVSDMDWAPSDNLWKSTNDRCTLFHFHLIALKKENTHSSFLCNQRYIGMSKDWLRVAVVVLHCN